MLDTNEEKLIVEHLKYLGLDLNNIPEFLNEYNDVDYKPSKAYEQNDFKIYRYINVNDIEILLSPTNRLDSVSDKYIKAIPFCEFIKENNDEQNLISFAKFLKMVENLNIKEIEKIEKEQLQVKNNVPFMVKYDTNYLWEIYYSEYTNKFFMIVTLEDQDYNAFFYLLKKKIECYKNEIQDEFIFVPICYQDYTKRYLKKSEISDIEKFIWIFTKDWPKIYEVFDTKNEMKIHIVGNADVYNKIRSDYKIELSDKEECTKFYTLVKALFILRTELPHHYEFDTQINEKGELIFELNNKLIDYKNLYKFIKDEYEKNASELKKIFEDKEKCDIELSKLKEEECEKSKEFLHKEKQVATYLECKKTVFGKIKYFFKNKNEKFKKSKADNSKTKKIKEENKMQYEIANSVIEEKELYTIEDLIKICIELDRINVRIKDCNLDIKAIKDRIKVIDGKIKNATLFINTIEEHKKSIFEFWRFSNQNVAPGLNAAQIEEKKETKNKIKRAFDFEEDIEELGIEADKIQRSILSNEETNSLYLATTDIIDDMNKINKAEEIKEINKEITDSNLEYIIGDDVINNFDIFGNIKNDMTKVSTLQNKKHRESKKVTSKIIDISNNCTLDDYKRKIEKHNQIINNSIDKMKALVDMDVFFVSDSKLNLDEIKKFYINPNDAINENLNLEKFNLYKIKIKEGMNLIYNTNIIYYDNFNNTLPIGMDSKPTVLFDMNRYKLDLKKQKIFRISRQTNELKFEENIICAYEYETQIKK